MSALIAAAGGLLLRLAPLVVGALRPKLGDLIDQFETRQITREQLDARLDEAALEAFTEVEVKHADVLGKTYAEFMQAAQRSLMMRVVWASVTFSQLLVLLWHQVGISALVYFGGRSWPSSGSTVEWAYLLVAFCLGAGPIVLRSGPGAAGVVENIKNLRR